MKNLLFYCLLAACGHGTEKSGPSDPLDADRALFNEAADRLEAMSDSGWVVSRNAENGAEHLGDSLIWTGMAMGDLDCVRGDAQEASLIAMLHETGGKIYRHPSLKTEASMDGAMGLYYGVARRIARCGDTWSAPLIELPEFWVNPLDTSGEARLPAEFTYVRDLLGFKVGVLPEPASSRKGALEAEVSAWALGSLADKSSCFRVHLGLLALQTIEALGGSVSQTGRNAFCSVTKTAGLPTVDLWCGRPTTFLADFKYNDWEVRSQRCPAWETPDGAPFTTPAVDLITFLRSAYTI